MRSIYALLAVCFVLASCDRQVRLKYVVKNDSPLPTQLMYTTHTRDSSGYDHSSIDTLILFPKSTVQIAESMEIMGQKNEDFFHRGLDTVLVAQNGTIYSELNLMDEKYWELTWLSGGCVRYLVILKPEYFRKKS